MNEAEIFDIISRTKKKTIIMVGKTLVLKLLDTRMPKKYIQLVESKMKEIHDL